MKFQGKDENDIDFIQNKGNLCLELDLPSYWFCFDSDISTRESKNKKTVDGGNFFWVCAKTILPSKFPLTLNSFFLNKNKTKFIIKSQLCKNESQENSIAVISNV